MPGKWRPQFMIVVGKKRIAISEDASSAGGNGLRLPARRNIEKDDEKAIGEAADKGG